MTTMISELYEALINAGATEEKAREATQALSAENLNSKDTIAEVKAELASDIAGLDEKLSDEIAETRKDIHKLQLDVAVLKWMVGATLAGIAAILASVVPILVKLFFAA